MMRRILSAALALALALGAGPSSAQVATDAPGLREAAGRLLAAGDAARARDAALVLLSRDPADVAALLLLGRAELQAGDPAAALVAARRAHAEAGDARARFTAARLAAKANAELGRWTRAQVWLRRARGDAPNAEAVAAVARDYRAVTVRNPLAVSLSFGIAPSSNVNGGTTSDTVWSHVPLLGWAEAPVEGDTGALSGLRLSFGGSLSYRVASSARSVTSVDAQISGRTYVLSDDALELKPDARGSDYADTTLITGVNHGWQGQDGIRSSLSFHLGQTWYDSAPFVRFSRLGFERRVTVGGADRFSVAPFAEQTNRLDFDETYWSLGARGSWTHVLSNRNRATLSLAYRDSLTALADIGYDGVVLGSAYEWGRPIRGLRVGFSTELDWRDYERSNYAEDRSRQDLTGRFRITVGLPRVDFYGFYPSLSVEASRTESDASLYDKQTLTVDLGFRSSF